MGFAGKRSSGRLGVMDEGGKWVRTAGWRARGGPFLTTYPEVGFRFLPEPPPDVRTFQNRRVSVSFNHNSPAINHRAVCVIAVNIPVPAEVFVPDLSSRLLLIRFCWAVPAVQRGPLCLARLPPPLTIIKKNDANVVSESTPEWRRECKADAAQLPGEPPPPARSRPQPRVINQHGLLPDG